LRLYSLFSLVSPTKNQRWIGAPPLASFRINNTRGSNPVVVELIVQWLATAQCDRKNDFAEGAFCAAVDAQRKATAIVSAVRIIPGRYLPLCRCRVEHKKVVDCLSPRTARCALALSLPAAIDRPLTFFPLGETAKGSLAKEHQKVEEQQATIAELKRAIARLTARDEEQAAQIQKVSAQLELSKAAPQTVLNRQ
jgi:hypothetical protein